MASLCADGTCDDQQHHNSAQSEKLLTIGTEPLHHGIDLSKVMVHVAIVPCFLSKNGYSNPQSCHLLDDNDDLII